MHKPADGPRLFATILGIGAVVAILAPVGVYAAGQFVTIGDPQTNSKARVDQGKLRVGDGSGAMDVAGTVGVSGTVDVDEPGRGADILAQGDCAADVDDPQAGTVPSGKTVTGVVLTMDHGGVSVTTLTVTAPSSLNDSDRLYSLVVGTNYSGYADFNEQLDFGPGIELDEVWSFNCTGQPGSSDGHGLWIVYGY